MAWWKEKSSFNSIHTDKIYFKMSTEVEFSISTDKVWKHRPKTHGLNMSSNWRREGVTNSFDKDDLRLRVGECIVSRPCIKRGAK